MAMGRRKNRTRTPELWIAANELPRTGGHPLYLRLNQVLDAHAFDEFVEAQCAPFYAETVGRPSLTAGTYFRLPLIDVDTHRTVFTWILQVLATADLIRSQDARH